MAPQGTRHASGPVTKALLGDDVEGGGHWIAGQNRRLSENVQPLRNATAQ